MALDPARPAARGERTLRIVLLVGYVATAAFALLHRSAPRVFWTGLLPLFPIVLAVAGFHAWRRVCPLAAFQLLGARLHRLKQRRVGPRLERWSYVVSLGLLAASLATRLLVTNGDHVALGVFLVGLALASFGVGAVYTGKTWCNFICPVGIVEKIYTEPASLRRDASSQCVKCTACKKSCPDIEQEQAYWKELDVPSRRTAYYLFPGLVVAFYLAYALPRGTLADYFDGAWTDVPREWARALSPGLWLAPSLPRLVVMPAALALGMALSYGVFRLVERLLARGREPERARHLALSAAAFVAFNAFYLFAGQPLYRRLAGLPVAMSMVAVSVATLVLVKRSARRRHDHVEEKTVDKLLRKWTFDEPPPSDPKEVLALVKVKARHREEVLAIYGDAIEEVLADGVVDQHEQRLLERMRAQLGVTAKEHEQVVARLPAEERALLEDPGRARPIEERLQEQGYRLALETLLTRRPTAADIEELRRSYGVSAERHGAIYRELRSPESPLRSRVEQQLARLEELHADASRIAPLVASSPYRLLALVLGRRLVDAADRAIEAMALALSARSSGASDAERADAVRALRPALLREAADPRDAEAATRSRAEAMEELGRLCDPEAVARLGAVLLTTPRAAAPAPSPEELRALLARHLEGTDPMLLAGALLAAAAVQDGDQLRARHGALARHPHPLVREAFALAMVTTEPPQYEALDPLTHDDDPRVRAAATISLEAADAALDDSVDISASTAPRLSRSGTLSHSDGRRQTRRFESLTTPLRMLSLSRIPLFLDLEPEHLYDLACLSRDRAFAAGELLVREGERGDELFVVRDGRAEVLVGPLARGRVVGEVGRGDCVGEMAVIEQRVRNATVRALGELHALSIDGASFRGLLALHSDLATRLLGVLVRRLSLGERRRQDDVARAAGDEEAR